MVARQYHHYNVYRETCGAGTPPKYAFIVCLVTFGLFVLVTFGLVTLGCFNQEGVGLHFITMVYMASCGVGHVCHSHWRADVSL